VPTIRAAGLPGCQRSLTADVAGLCGETTGQVGEIVRQHPPQERRPRRIIELGELRRGTVRLQQRLLDDVGGVDLGPQLDGQLQPRKQTQVLAVAFPGQSGGGIVHVSQPV
jgi:hypothetical protein